MKTPVNTLRIPLVITVCWLAAGCTSSNLVHEAQRSDSLVDFVGSLVGHPRKDVVPVRRISAKGGEIATAHAEVIGERKTRVSGIVKKDFGYGADEAAHIDVKVLGPSGRLLVGQATTYFPNPIPADYHGTIGRSNYSVNLPLVPPPSSTVQVMFHNVPLAECEFVRASENL